MTDLSRLSTKFLSALDALCENESDRVCLAVSGGADSMAMLLLAAEAIPHRISVATVDHGLRAEAVHEAAFVAGLCIKLGIAHQVLTPNKPIAGNLQSQARAARYEVLQQHAGDQNCCYIATAHHRDDQVETFLMRLARGSGVDGLSSIRRHNGNIVRPMLDFSRIELEQICTSHDIKPIQDPSNQDDAFDRARMRKWLRSDSLPFDAKAVQCAADALSDASEALTWMTDQLAAERLKKTQSAIEIDMRGLPAELRRRMLLRALSEFHDGSSPRGEAVTRAIAALESDNKTMLGDAIITPGDLWHISKAPARRQ